MKLGEHPKTIPAQRVVLVPPHVFADTWPDKPSDSVAFGIRTLSEMDKRSIRSVALSHAKELADSVEDPFEVYNDALVRMLVSRGVCDPNNIVQPPDLMRFADDQVFYALTESGARYLFDEILKLEVETTPVHPEASGEDIMELLSFFGKEGSPLDLLSAEERSSVLRHLRFAVDILRESFGSLDETEADPFVESTSVPNLLADVGELVDQ